MSSLSMLLLISSMMAALSSFETLNWKHLTLAAILAV